MKDVTIDNIIRAQHVEDYLNCFENKDIEGISSLLSEICTLRDWNSCAIVGKSNVLDFISNIFKSCKIIEVDVLHLHEDPDTIICEMSLDINGNKMLVADIIGFDDNDNISFIRAYRGN